MKIKQQPKKVDVAIVGGGIAAPTVIIGMLGEFRSRGATAPRNAVIIEPADELGVGTPWSAAKNNAFMSTNMPIETIKVFGRVLPNGMLDLITPANVLPGTTARRDGQSYAQRRDVGTGLAKRSDAILKQAALDGLAVEHVKSVATDVEPHEDGWLVRTASGATVLARCVVFSIGLLSINRFPSLDGIPGYHGDGWDPGDLLDRIDPEHRVCIIGCGPTAIDWVLRLEPANLRFPVHMVSPSGLLPAARPLVSKPPAETLYTRTRLEHASRKHGPFGPMAIEEVVIGVLGEAGVKPSELATYLRLARAGGSDLLEWTMGRSNKRQAFFDAMKVLDDIAPALWRYASEEGRVYVASRLAKLHATFSFAIPPHNGDAILAAIKTGRLITAANFDKIEAGRDGFRVKFVPGTNAHDDIVVDVVINATGFDGKLAQSNNPLIGSLLARELIIPERHGGIAMDYETGCVRDAAGEVVPGLHAVGGTFSKSAAYLVNALADTTEHAVHVGRHCARYLLNEADKPKPSGRRRPVKAPVGR